MDSCSNTKDARFAIWEGGARSRVTALWTAAKWKCVGLVYVRCHGHKVKCRPSDGKVKVVLRGDGKINTMQSCHIPEITGCGLIGISFC